MRDEGVTSQQRFCSGVNPNPLSRHGFLDWKKERFTGGSQLPKCFVEKKCAQNTKKVGAPSLHGEENVVVSQGPLGSTPIQDSQLGRRFRMLLYTDLCSF